MVTVFPIQGILDRLVQRIVDLVGFAHALRLTVVAEGVETVRQRDDAEALGCNACQGYYFAKPMPPCAMDTLLSHRVAGTNPCLPMLAAAS